MTIYVVEGSTGEYSDHREWLVRAYADKTKAQDKVLRCQERARQAAVDGADSYERDDVLKQYQDEDPNMEIDYTGARYCVREVEYEP